MCHRLAVVLALTCNACGLVGFDDLVGRGDGGVADGSVLPAGTLGHACAFDRITVILDGEATDDEVGADMAAAIAAGCGTSPTVRMLDQNTPGLLDPTTFAPSLGPDDLGVFGGDSYYQHIVTYLEMSAAPVYSADDASFYRIRHRATGADIVDVPHAEVTETHDFAAIQIVHDAATDATFVTTFGLYYRGTLAGSYYFRTVIAPTLARETHGYFVIEWTNADGDTNPSAGDAYVLLARGK